MILCPRHWLCPSYLSKSLFLKAKQRERAINVLHEFINGLIVAPVSFLVPKANFNCVKVGYFAKMFLFHMNGNVTEQNSKLTTEIFISSFNVIIYFKEMYYTFLLQRNVHRSRPEQRNKFSVSFDAFQTTLVYVKGFYVIEAP